MLFLTFDLIAATTNALSGGLLAQRPDHYRGNYFTVIGLLGFAVIGGVTGVITRDVLVGIVPSALTNPWYIGLSLIAGVVALAIAYSRTWQFRETTFQLITSFALPWYAVVGVERGLENGLPLIAAVFLGVVSPTAGRLLIDVACRAPVKIFVRGEWFVGTAVLVSLLYTLLAGPLDVPLVAATFVAFGVGFAFRAVAIWKGWEEPLPRLPYRLLRGAPRREGIEEKLQEDHAAPSGDEPPR